MFSACLFELEATCGQLCVKSSLEPHMEPSPQQEPTEKQHQTISSAVSSYSPHTDALWQFEKWFTNHWKHSTKVYLLKQCIVTTLTWLTHSRAHSKASPQVSLYCIHLCVQIWNARAGSGQDCGSSGGSKNPPHFPATGWEGGPGVPIPWEPCWGTPSILSSRGRPPPSTFR